MGLLFFYTGYAVSIGESWTDWSYIELIGFSLLMYGTFAYKGIIKMSWVDEQEYILAEQDERALQGQVRDEAEKSGMAYNMLVGDMNDDYQDLGGSRGSQGGLSLK